ncbi:MAG: arsenosugar biosynthesis radical SAM (seleno)protein ArsS [Oceanococcaceae bacterium]
MRQTLALLEDIPFPALRRRKPTTLQVNLGYLCNQACLHCHVNAGPTRKELMDADTVALLLEVIDGLHIQTLDVTGGAPEMNPHFRDLISAARSRGVHCMDRCNLTILEQPGYEWAAGFLAEQQVEVVASLPCYLEDNVDAQRGNGVFRASLAGLQKLNALGYGQPGSGLQLSLVYNPQGPSLPPPQESLEADYRQHLQQNYGVVFNQLFTLANMPIQRFGSTLVSRGQFGDYMQLLRQAHRPENLDGVMCRDLLSVDYQGYVYDCDFNQMLGLPLGAGASGKTHLREVLQLALEESPIRVAGHCYGCTAGQGSSCGGALN